MMIPANNNRDLLGPDRHHNAIGPGAAAMGQIDTNPVVQAQPATPTGDLLGFNAPPQQQHQQPSQQQVINATHATVSITTTGASAPSIAGIGRIEPSAQNNNNGQNKPKRKTIYVPTYSCNGGLDTKFNHYARYAKPPHLHNLLTPEEYEREIQTLNDKTKKARAKSLDYALLATGMMIVPLALWGARHGRQVKRKRTLLEEGVWEFNERMGMDGKNVRMVWNRAKLAGGGESYLTIGEVEVEEGDGTGSKKFD
mmetsp:Transcript_20627/g.44806  ORF Transcript_20627/g.44806 Transcript_20627/m.44806 type:complete len:254 (+) Transcript_20627:109-870(+)|eukprot:CAMPEP_0172320554 /NCGR_PEP_ID=MMETSP1058-20130122/40793_1 /TAXON_ID=83371 /ORGANISM="Detonula confervacea, Strain CCMP 353" /LENGTH=253 /DNA_ID=CAMNT_0013035843 /DNA_START=45 /DNA_END=806 /DNA_ORIENTATION=+